MSLTDRDDYDALARVAKELPVYERTDTVLADEPKKPPYGCFSCDHSVGSMSPDKKYTTVFIYPFQRPPQRFGNL